MAAGSAQQNHGRQRSCSETCRRFEARKGGNFESETEGPIRDRVRDHSARITDHESNFRDQSPESGRLDSATKEGRIRDQGGLNRDLTGLVSECQ